MGRCAGMPRVGATVVTLGLLLGSCSAQPHGVGAVRSGRVVEATTADPPTPTRTRSSFSTGSPSRMPTASPSRTAPSSALGPIAVPAVPLSVRRRLPEATTFTVVRGAPTDLHASPTGRLAHLPADRLVVGFRRPGGDPVVRVPVFQLAHRTVLPVVRERPGWVQVRLPSKPNGAVAWLPARDVRLESDGWRAVVDLGARTLTITRGATRLGRWSVGVGQATTPTPTGQTFLLSRFDSPPGHYTPVTFVLGTHSSTLDTYGGGPGTVAFHGWPTASGRHGAVSHGCVRVPPEALTLLRRAPLGMPVLIH